MLSRFSDVTYVLAILLVSRDSRYLIANASWLAGSGLTIFLDIFVMGQFAVYNLQDRRREDERKVLDGGGDAEREGDEERA